MDTFLIRYEDQNELDAEDEGMFTDKLNVDLDDLNMRRNRS